MPDGSRLDPFELSRTNDDFRRVITTGAHSQLVVMTIAPGGEIGEEVHEDVDQWLLSWRAAGRPCSRESAAP